MAHFNLFSRGDHLPPISSWQNGVLLVLSFWAASVAAEVSGCPTLRHGYGPYDYRSATKEQRALVEGAHFFPNVENLRENTPHPNRGYIVVPGSEIDYTLRAFPNHHRALMAASKLALRDKTDRPNGLKTSIDCYFKSALEFRQDDSYVPMIYGIHLAKKGRTTEAIEYFDKAKLLGDDSANLHYNLGLAYFQVKRYDEALASAQKAYAAGFPLAGLRNMLERIGKWKEMPDKETDANKSNVPDEGVGDKK